MCQVWLLLSFWLESYREGVESAPPSSVTEPLEIPSGNRVKENHLISSHLKSTIWVLFLVTHNEIIQLKKYPKFKLNTFQRT